VNQKGLLVNKGTLTSKEWILVESRE
jgi:hypothetical protein